MILGTRSILCCVGLRRQSPPMYSQRALQHFKVCFAPRGNYRSPRHVRIFGLVWRVVFWARFLVLISGCPLNSTGGRVRDVRLVLRCREALDTCAWNGLPPQALALKRERGTVEAEGDISSNVRPVDLALSCLRAWVIVNLVAAASACRNGYCPAIRVSEIPTCYEKRTLGFRGLLAT